eukprot:TRINITY_DN25976_c0_g1_i1.p1 TRINITY_DN25976_c0_g1~~TRINITY_DN25976_c0_g1_i1.p1  ORF type:complete len:652 (+),score=127.54 TRINITY_DN25976_c0_g1_i1:90-2045(+)
MAGAETWNTHAEKSPLFVEYLNLASDCEWNALVHKKPLDIGPLDALLVIDMQNDFIPQDDLNKKGGAFGVQEGAVISPLVCQLMEYFAQKGGAVVATRDYHPANHCSFLSEDGPFPSHCVQGTVGSHFYKPVGELIQKLRKEDKRMEVVFKGFHEDTDSFAAFPYPDGDDDEDMKCRVCTRDIPERLYGCTQSGWTGSFVLESSNSYQDVNAPPDVMAVLKRVALKDWLMNQGIRRVFVCGLALDFCVLDTILNAAGSQKFSNVYMVLDAVRAAHIPGIGRYGSGFLSDPTEVKAKLAAKGGQVVASSFIIDGFTPSNPFKCKSALQAVFPQQLGPFALVQTKKLVMTFDRKARTYKAMHPMEEIRTIEKFGYKAEGQIAPVIQVTLDDESKASAGIPKEATEFFWCNPIYGLGGDEKARAYFSTSTPSAAFLVYGGYVYLDKRGRICKMAAIGLGEGLRFGAPQPWASVYTTSLTDRWQPVTVPYLRERGVYWFCWLNPGEVVPALGKKHVSHLEDWKSTGPHGGFVYLFHRDIDGESDRNCYFPVVSAEPQKSSADSTEELESMFVDHIRTSGKGGKKSANQAQIERIFKSFDEDRTGTISKDELRLALKQLTNTFSEQMFTQMFQNIDANKDGEICYSEFIKWVFADA